ncbi:MAG: hypothetical protein R2849_17415 [Thermomicrobiales bacterium]
MDGETIRLYLDNTFVGEATDDRYEDAGSAGLQLDGTINIEASEFRVFAIETQ